MRVFLLDLWLDLREKRLAPIAIALLALIVAVPIVLANDSEPAPPPPTTTTAAAAAPVVESDTEADAADSKLQSYNPRDPFEPTAEAAPSTSTTSGTTTGTTGGTTTGTTTTGGGGTETGTTPSGGGTTGTEPSTGTGTGTTGGTGTTTGQTRTQLFTYTVDARFGPPGSQKLYKGVKRLELLPNEDDPKLVFLGVTATGKTAVFLVDANLGVDTEGGKCRPSPDECTFLYLRPDEEHDQALLTDANGDSFRLRLLDIDRVTVSSSNGGNSGSGNSGGNNGQSGTGDRSPAFTGSTRGDKSDASDPGDTPPGEPNQRFNFSGFFRDADS